MKDLWLLREYHKRKIRERFWLWFIWRLPKPLIYWASIRLIAHATSNQYSNTIVPDLSAMDALKRWE